MHHCMCNLLHGRIECFPALLLHPSQLLRLRAPKSYRLPLLHRLLLSHSPHVILSTWTQQLRCSELCFGSDKWYSVRVHHRVQSAGMLAQATLSSDSDWATMIHVRRMITWVGGSQWSVPVSRTIR